VSFTCRMLNSRGKSPGTSLIGDWMGPRAGLDAVAKRKNPTPVTIVTELPRFIRKTINLPVVLYGCEIWSPAYRGT
jgi:hypothetical protein